MGQVVWTNFAISELKNVFLYYRMVANSATAEKKKKSILSSTKILTKNHLMGAIEENLIELKQEHRYLVKGNYKIIYRIINKDVYITDIFDCRQNPEKMKIHHKIK